MRCEKYIVMTSIFPPTKAVNAFSGYRDHRLIVVGDRKTPAGWECDNVEFLPVSGQETLKYRIGRLLPYDHYCRKMLGYLFAIEKGAQMIIDTDDDNVPLEKWAFPEFQGIYPYSKEGMGFINIYRRFTDKKIWPRGFPLNRINSKASLLMDGDVSKANVKVGAWQGLADGDPDVDAIYRLVDGSECRFEDRAPVVLGKGTVCPFNSQNTAFIKEAFPLLYLPSYVTFRFTDILRGLVAQPVMWAAGYRLGFTGATVFQERNPHDYIKDFESEIPCYLAAERIIDIAAKAVCSGRSISRNLYVAYRALLNDGIVVDEELEILKAWLKDLDGIWGKREPVRCEQGYPA